MNLTAYELSLIAGGFGIVGAILGAYIGYYFSTRLINRQDFNKAAAEFRNAFTNQLNVLKSNVNSGRGDTSNIGEYLRAHYVGYHLSTFEVFRNYLTPKERVSIDSTWKEYCNFNQYSDKNNQEAMRKLALKNLKDVLKFAKHK
ncbi:MAG: hypothetical protein KKB05_01545 [Proteobacteria bacterium]|nr:hypothetical protein [Pseudomonadota bacterium]